MKLISWNVNGLRAIERKGFLPWFQDQNADVVCLQETRARPEQLSEVMRRPLGYHADFCCAEKGGYSGVVTYSKVQPTKVVVGMAFDEIDREGRILVSYFEHFTLVNAYMPHARRDLSRKEFKLAFCERFLSWLDALKAEGRPLIICGDYNVAHREIDLTNARANRKNAGFLPEERAWMDTFLARGFRDVFRDRRPEETGHYTWWSNRKGVRERNVGWRIDYFLVDERLAENVTLSEHQPHVMGSDHCPIAIEVELS